MKKVITLVFLFPLLINSCTSSDDIKTISPTGSPSVCFYNQGKNANFVTESSTPKVVAQFQNNEYDCIVIDANSGLQTIKEHNKSYAFMRLLTKNNLYLISNKKNKKPTNGDTIMAFPYNKDSTAHLCLIKYLKQCLISDSYIEKINWSDGVTSIVQQINIDANKFDYYLIAEPFYTTLKNKYIWSVNISSELGFDIPQASLFINKNKYNAKKDKFSEYLNVLNNNLNTNLNDYNSVANCLKEYGDDQTLIQRFGFTSDVYISTQSHNGFGINNPKNKYGKNEINSFLNAVGYQQTYDESYFIEV